MANTFPTPLKEYETLKMGLQCFSLTKKRRLIFTISISLSFFLLELICKATEASFLPLAVGLSKLTPFLVVGFRTGSLALIADAFHYVRSSSAPRASPANMPQLNDLIGFSVALAALLVSFAEGPFGTVKAYLFNPALRHRSRSAARSPKPSPSGGSADSSSAGSSTVCFCWRSG